MKTKPRKDPHPEVGASLNIIGVDRDQQRRCCSNTNDSIHQKGDTRTELNLHS